MNHYKTFRLQNGLQLFVIEDKETPMAVVNLLYDVGSRDEDPEATGFAHLFEHLMFGGSKNVPSFDTTLQNLSGDNNAFTSPDITNYYDILPVNNLESALWVEADRMHWLTLDQKALDVQRGVVIEEFRQRYLNQPYGDVWFHLRALAYKKHPYRWPTIGKEIRHIEEANLEMVSDFYQTYYAPNNAILVIASSMEADEVHSLTQKWFGDIPSGKHRERNLEPEPPQTAPRFKTVDADVPVDAIYKVYHGPQRTSPAYYHLDLFSDLITKGMSSELNKTLVQEQRLFSSIQSSMIGSADPGLFYLHGRVSPGVAIANADAALAAELERIIAEGVSDQRLTGVKNKWESAMIFGRTELLNRAMTLAIYANMGQPELVAKEDQIIEEITSTQIFASAAKYLKPSNCSTVHYKKAK